MSDLPVSISMAMRSPGALGEQINRPVAGDGMLERGFIPLLLELFSNLHNPVLMFQAGAKDRAGIDAGGFTGGAAMVGQLIQYDLAGTSGQRYSFNDTGISEMLTHGIASSA